MSKPTIAGARILLDKEEINATECGLLLFF